MRVLPLTLATLVSALPVLSAPRPGLVVVISVDQFSEELMARWGRDLPGGLGRLAREGTWFQAAYHDHAFTETGPGHSVILSGRPPAGTGITENLWLDRATGKWIYCVSDPASPILGVPKRGVSAVNFRATTLGQWVRSQIPGGRSFAMTGKDRAAILMSGAQTDGAYWFEPEAGFTTATAYSKALPQWLQDHDRRLLEGFSTGSFFWEASSGQPESGGTFLVRGQPVSFGLPRMIQAVGMPRDGAFWGRFKASPFFDQSILDAAEALIEHEGLGRGKGTSDFVFARGMGGHLALQPMGFGHDGDKVILREGWVQDGLDEVSLLSNRQPHSTNGGVGIQDGCIFLGNDSPLILGKRLELTAGPRNGPSRG